MDPYDFFAAALIEDCVDNIRRLLKKRASKAQWLPSMQKELDDEVAWLVDPDNLVVNYLLPSMTGRDILNHIKEEVYAG